MEEIITEYWKNLSLENIVYLNEEGVERVEEWQPLVGYENEYSVSDLGRLKSVQRKMPRNHPYKSNHFITINEKIKVQYLRKDGYLSCGLRDEDYVKMHIAVAKAFIPNPENKPTVNHKKGIRTDNRKTQLEWFTFAEQNIHAFRVLGKVQVRKGKFGKDCSFSVGVICLNDGKKYDSMTEAGNFYGIKSGHISESIRTPHIRKHAGKGYKFKLIIDE